MSGVAEIPAVSAAELDALLERAGLKIRPEWQPQMLIEYAQLRMNMNVIHELANSCPDPVNIRQPITFGRVEE
ncbi:hypothetical protein [Agrobacterium sp. LAD9]|uniref:hypothetical protein n=1 Tax=Agrobacterium sp. LAD9 TaxID=2055153 RepID=UPI000D1D769B|nr:hypothetical protein [Agrobacterium sp. LAD9]